jgi:hypothetical protein
MCERYGLEDVGGGYVPGKSGQWAVRGPDGRWGLFLWDDVAVFNCAVDELHDRFRWGYPEELMRWLEAERPDLARADLITSPYGCLRNAIAGVN